MEPAPDYRFYGELAGWWPLISPHPEYTEEAAEVARLVSGASIPVVDVLELGSGGGHNAVHLKAYFTLTLVDLAPEMVAVSRDLNPECEHHVGDMRTVRLGQRFDAVFVHDAVDYLLTADDLRAAMETAFVHCRPGGLALFMPDDTAETYEPGTFSGGGDLDDGRGARYLQWSLPADGTTVVTEYAFLLRDADGSVRVVREAHRTGLFPERTWLRLLAEVGFEPSVEVEVSTEDRPPRRLFVGRRPLDEGE